MDAEMIGPMPESYAIHCIQLKAAGRSDNKRSFDMPQTFLSAAPLAIITHRFCRPA
jgi:hypothetical protein